MKRVLTATLPAPGKPRRVLDSEAHHLLRVLRLEDGDRVEALDGSGRSVTAILRLRSGDAWLEFDGSGRHVAPAAGILPVILEMAVLKGDAMEWVIEKAAELGVRSVVPVLCKRTVVQVDRKGPGAFQQRWQKIADQALKQCGRLERMRVEAPIALSELLSTGLSSGESRWLLDEETRESARSILSATREVGPGSGSLRLLVGPEGGWDPEERALLSAGGTAGIASLGPLILRAETAAIAAVSIVTAALRETSSSR